VRFFADRPVRHGAGGEALDDLIHRLHVVQRHGRGRPAKIQEAPQRRVAPRLVVDQARVLLEDGVLAGARRVLQLEHRLGREEMVFGIAPPLVFAADGELRPAAGPRGVRHAMALERLARDPVDADAADAGRGSDEVRRDDGRVEADGLEDLGAAVALQRRDPHLRHHLEDALVERVDVVLDRARKCDADQVPFPDEVVDRLEREVRVHDACAVAQKERAVMHLACVARLDDQTAAGARTAAHEMLVDRGGREQARNRRPVAIGVPIRQDDDGVARGDRVAGALLQLFERARETPASARRVKDHRQRGRAERRQVHVAQPRELLVIDHGVVDRDLAAGFRPGLEQVPLGPDRRRHGRDHLLADRVERRVRDLRKRLLEIVVQQVRPIRQHGQRRVGAHGTDRLLAVQRHGGQQQPQVLIRVAEHLLPLRDRLVPGARKVGGRTQLVDVHEVVADPVRVRMRGGELPLQFLVGHDAAARGVHEEDASGLHAPLEDDLLRLQVEHADFRRHHHQAVARDAIARRAQAVPVQYGADDRPVREGDRRRAVPGLHQRRVVLVERP